MDNLKAPVIAPSPSSSADDAFVGTARDRRGLAAWILIAVFGLACGIEAAGLTDLVGNRRWMALDPECAWATEEPTGETEVE